MFFSPKFYVFFSLVISLLYFGHGGHLENGSKK